MLQLFRCVVIDTKPQQQSLLELRPSAEFSSKISTFSRSLADFLSVLAFLLCYFIFDSYVTSLTLTIHIIFCAFIVLNSSYFGHIQIILSQSRCSLEPKNFLMGASPLKPPLRGSEQPCPPQPPSSIDSHYACFSADYVYSWNDVCLITIVGFKLKILHKTI